MSEVTKLYENARVEKSKCFDDCTTCTRTSCDKNISYIQAEYPPFTVEKVIRLLEWEANRGIIDIKHSQKGYQIFTYIHTGNYGKSIIDAVASYFCVKWQDLTEEEKQQIKEILE